MNNRLHHVRTSADRYSLFYFLCNLMFSSNDSKAFFICSNALVRHIVGNELIEAAHIMPVLTKVRYCRRVRKNKQQIVWSLIVLG